jgi:hypothetical protein
MSCDIRRSLYLQREIRVVDEDKRFCKRPNIQIEQTLLRMRFRDLGDDRGDISLWGKFLTCFAYDLQIPPEETVRWCWLSSVSELDIGR